MDEGIVETGEDSGNTENQLSWYLLVIMRKMRQYSLIVPSRTWGPREMFSLAGLGAPFFGGILTD